jgi:hypothetical protein
MKPPVAPAALAKRSVSTSAKMATCLRFERAAFAANYFLLAG